MNEKERNPELDEEKTERPDYAEQLVTMLHSDIDVLEKKERLEDYHANDIADVLPLLTTDERIRLYKLLGEDEVSEVFAYLEDPAEYISELDIEKAADIVENMDADDAVDFLEDLDTAQKSAILSRMDEDSRRDIDLIQSYDEDEIGSKMTTNYIVITRGSTVKQAMRSLVRQAAENDNLQTIYVLNRDGTFYGAISLQSLIIAREFADLDDLVVTSYPFVYDYETVSECIEDLKDYSEDSIPVLNRERRLLGVITSTDLIEVVDDELGEDYAKLAGLTAEEDLNEPLLESMKKRISWLIILMCLALVVSSVVGIFESVMASLTILVAFQSLVLDMAGNCGTQSLAVTIRVLSDEELTAKERAHLIIKDSRVALCNGLVLGLMAFVFCGFYIHLAKQVAWGPSYQISMCIGAALTIAMFISGVSGTVIPMFFHKIHVDPAVASGPLITTINDLVAVFSYYGLAWLFLIEMLHMQV
ncbi:MAG: magnesium transporter [Clostridia bacterium]|nr:magnesium transporter [Clostridia bacterium]